MIARPDDGQPTLDFTPRARESDPETSRDAASVIDGEALAGRVLDYLRLQGDMGATSHEIAAGLHLSLVTVSPRLAPLQRAGLVTALRDAHGRVVRRKVAGQRVGAQVWVAVR